MLALEIFAELSQKGIWETQLNLYSSYKIIGNYRQLDRISRLKFTGENFEFNQNIN
jgi:hypothetical protein